MFGPEVNNASKDECDFYAPLRLIQSLYFASSCLYSPTNSLSQSIDTTEKGLSVQPLSGTFTIQDGIDSMERRDDDGVLTRTTLK